MADYADLEMTIRRRDGESYAVDFRFSHTQTDADTRLIWRGEPPVVSFDQDRLQTLGTDPPAYGKLLTEQLFASTEMYEAFNQAWTTAQSLGMPLRLRLFLDPGASELHRLYWETLRHPQTGDLLLTQETILFSRYLSSVDSQPVRLRPRSELRALVVIANPGDVSDYAPGGTHLTPLDVEGETTRAQQGLGTTMPITLLAAGGTATLDNIIRQMHEGCDMLYLVAHGAIIKGEPYLWLENEDGKAAVCAGNELVTRIRELQQRPRLVVLASCQSAGAGEDGQSSDQGALAGLGPLLAEAGVPAVLAMQSSVSMKTVALFFPTFFQELQRDGHIDRAMAVARGRVRDRFDWWVPVLFMRLKSGRIWYIPGFGEDRKSFEKWPALIRSIQRGVCTPILGPRLTQTLLDSPHDIARKWAETYNFPMEPGEQDDLPQVAQYLAVNQDTQFPRYELLEYLRKEILSRYKQMVPDLEEQAKLDNLFATVGSYRRERDPADPYRVLAELPFPIYITTNLSNLLDEALTASGKAPRVELCRWNNDLDYLPSIYDETPDYRPDVTNPLIYHLFGRCTEPDSLVVTEDDYFDFLIGVTQNKDLIPTVVRRALADTALLFLGFRLDDWNFRVLFRSIMNQEGGNRRRRYTHVAAQIDPEEGRILEPERARAYLESYFQNADISIFWGTVEDFVKELRGQMNG